MALGLSSGGDLYGPLSVAVVGGLAVSTLFTLIVVPTAYAAIRNKFPIKDYDTKDEESIIANAGNAGSVFGSATDLQKVADDVEKEDAISKDTATEDSKNDNTDKENLDDDNKDKDK